MTRRDTMRNTNRLCREWLLENKYDYIWLKPHFDSRKKMFKDFFHTRTNGKVFSQDVFNLFDGICFESTGMLTFLQLSTTNYHPEQPYRDFISDKFGFKILLMRTVKKKNRWQVQTKEILDHNQTHFIS